ncbi:hypothetical protein [Pedobacter mendelii]|uniref:Uncharacterized protein n=1 Tax=Pedobacter mendelii TaxID=1908240 RepID=A0ABQ2BGQ6_9SPHI|nr:hypothetical protein [Pedobacter mendelii]GGI23497.1 hypothetical protein GCM10008119_07940 [Pedobacter mendelii]
MKHKALLKITITMTTELLIINIGKKSAIFSFSIGTLLLLIYLATKAGVLIGFGLVYLEIAFFINIAVLSALLFATVAYSGNRKKTWLTILYVLLNLPIAFTYFLIVAQIA